MLRRCSLALVLALVAGLLALSGTSVACPEATGWYSANDTTKLCYRGLYTESLTYAEAQAKCNSLRSNLFQFNRGDTREIYELLQDRLYDVYNPQTMFRYASWIGLTDRAVEGKYVYLNGFTLEEIMPGLGPQISCPDGVPNCKPKNRCVYLNLDKRSTLGGKQILSGNCDDRMPAICYAPQGGTDKFDKIPALGASSTATSVAVLLLAGGLSAAFKSWINL